MISYLRARRAHRIQVQRAANLEHVEATLRAQDEFAIRAVLASADFDLEDAAVVDHIVVLVRDRGHMINQLYSVERKADRAEARSKAAERELRDVHEKMRELGNVHQRLRTMLGVEPFEEADLPARLDDLIERDREARRALADIARVLLPDEVDVHPHRVATEAVKALS